MKLLTLPGVFSPISDSWLLAEAIGREAIGPGSQILDVCTGSGVLALVAARSGACVTAVDVSRRALLSTRLNARRHHLKVTTLRGRSFEPVVGRRFDVIVSNPPYVPSERTTVPNRGASRAWEAGHDGRLVLDDLCDRAVDHLQPGGVVLLVHSSLIGESRTIERLRRSGLRDVRVVERRRGPLGPLMAAQQRAGNLAEDVAEEDVIVIRAVAPAPGDPS